MDRRSFLRRIGMGVAGLGALVIGVRGDATADEASHRSEMLARMRQAGTLTAAEWESLEKHPRS